uniref:Up-regulator of cell proliferation-like domain-containing protein n=1 Tax=Cyprinodon variegatus TaxID=28743 RepID=A0A3Q2CVJ0_CYPVA
NKLTLRSLLLINKDSMYDNPASSPKDIPRYFLTKLLQINADCRGCTELPDDEEEHFDPFSLQPSTAEANENKVNYLDLIVALFLCADSFLQQRMALRMSMCQFSFPLLLPHYNNSQSGLMLWTLRDIVKEWSTPKMSESKNFAEDSVAEIKAPFFSFVRLKNSSLSKSQLLNHILSHGQQNKDVFMHRDMEGGAHQREIANGLIEISWFLPSGRENQDVFQKPIIFANLRGDVSESPTEFSFLSQVSTAIFVLMDKIQEDEKKMLTSLHDVKSKLFFVFSPNKNTMKDTVSVKTMVEKLDIPKNQVITKDQKTNIAGFSKKFCATINKSPAHLTSCMSIVNMSDKAMELGLSVDEHRSDTQKKAAERIMEGIWVKTISDYKKQELCLQGENWKKISKIEKEECRLNKADDSTLEDYKAELQKEKEALRKEQSKYKPSNEMKISLNGTLLSPSILLMRTQHEAWSVEGLVRWRADRQTLEILRSS